MVDGSTAEAKDEYLHKQQKPVLVTVVGSVYKSNHEHP